MRKAHLLLWIVVWMFAGSVFPVQSRTVEDGVFTLEQIIEQAIEANIGLKQSREDTRAAFDVKDIERSRLLPTFSAGYRYRRNDDEVTIPAFGQLSLRDEYTFSLSMTQPLFSGFSLINQYEISALGIDVSKMRETLLLQNIVLAARQACFNFLKSRQLEAVSRETVHQISAHEQVAREFYDVGMIPLNDLLQARVELANAGQALTRASNALEEAAAALNTLLRRPLNSVMQVSDIRSDRLQYPSFEHDIDYCLDSAVTHRVEFKIADLQIQIAQKEVQVAKKDYYPSVNLQGIYRQVGDRPDTTGESGITDSGSWEVSAAATWNFWDWNRTRSRVREKSNRLAQARLQKQQFQDDIAFEVKRAYLKVRESEKNIKTAEQAIEQAKENFRINQERYQQQIATSTDVLDAQTLLSGTLTSYYNALYDVHISRAVLLRAMGQGGKKEGQAQ